MRKIQLYLAQYLKTWMANTCILMGREAIWRFCILHKRASMVTLRKEKKKKNIYIYIYICISEVCRFLRSTVLGTQKWSAICIEMGKKQRVYTFIPTSLFSDYSPIRGFFPDCFSPDEGVITKQAYRDESIPPFFSLPQYIYRQRYIKNCY